MPEISLRPVQSPAWGRVITEHHLALWRTAQLRYRDYLTRGGGIFYVGIPPADPNSREAAMWRWTWSSEIVVLPPDTYGYREIESADTDHPAPAERIDTARRLHWETTPNDARNVETMSWPQAATALLAPARLLHGWVPRWDDASPATVAGRPGTRVPLTLQIPWSDPRSYGDSLQPHWMDLYTEIAEVVIDDDRGVILEWSGLIDGQVFERNAFSVIDFDVQLSDRDFDPAALGLTKR